MKVAVLSHPCVTPVNQAVYGELADLTGWELCVIAPARWKDEYGTRTLGRHPRFRGELRGLPVLGKGSIPLHWYRRGIRSTLIELRPDVFFIHHEPYALATAQAMRACRGLPCTVGFYSAQNLAKRFPPPFAQLERWVFLHSTFAFPCSSTVANVLRAKGFRGSAPVVPLPIDTDAFSPRHRENRGNLRIGFVGRLVPEKGVDTLLWSLNALDREPVELIVVGEGPERERLESLATRLGVSARVTWRGYVPHDAVQGVFAEIDVLAVPSVSTSSWQEQFGRVVIEALASGTPVIASTCGELPSLVESLGGGWTFAERDHHDLASLIHRLLVDPQALHAAAEAGRGRVVERYSLRAVATTMAEVMRGARETDA